MPAAQRFFSRTALVLWLAATVGTACVMPYVKVLTPALDQAAHRLGVSVAVVMLLSVAQSAVLLAIMTFCGLWVAGKLAMGAPWLDFWLGRGERPRDARRALFASVVIGLASGVVLVALDLLLFLPLSPHQVGNLLRQPQPPWWAGLLASVEGGITEEVELRLFLLSLLAWGFRAVSRLRAKTPSEVFSARAFWAANLVAAILFGLGHLPVTSQMVSLTWVIVARAIVLNGIVGLVAGYLFWRRGLEMAMVCHFSADIVLHVLAPLLQSVV